MYDLGLPFSVFCCECEPSLNNRARKHIDLRSVLWYCGYGRLSYGLRGSQASRLPVCRRRLGFVSYKDILMFGKMFGSDNSTRLILPMPPLV